MTARRDASRPGPLAAALTRGTVRASQFRMHADPIAAALEQLLDEHRSDTDGGDRLVRAVIRHSRGLMPAARDELHRHLLELVDLERDGVWPVALEVLVRTGTPATGRALTPLLTSGERTSEWSDAVVLAMLRLGCANALGMCRDYVREELRMQHLGALPMLSWLYRTDVAFAVELGARFYADTLGRGGAGLPPGELRDELARHIPGQLDGLLASSAASALALVEQTTAIDPAAGRTLAAMIREYLAAPESRSELGPRAVEALGEAMRLRAG